MTAIFPAKRRTWCMWDMSSHFWDNFTEIAEISAFFLTFFTLAGVKILHLDKNWLCHCTAHHDGVQNGARIKSIPCTVSDLCRQVNHSEAVIATRNKSINGMWKMIRSFFVSNLGRKCLPANELQRKWFVLALWGNLLNPTTVLSTCLGFFILTWKIHDFLAPQKLFLLCTKLYEDTHRIGRATFFHYECSRK